MTKAHDSTKPLADLFGGDVLPPTRGEVSDRAYKRRYIPKTYSEVETRAAARVIAHWNQQFANVAGAFRANAGDAVNIKAYVKMNRSVEKAGDDFSYIDEPVIKQAITLYRMDPANMGLGRWKRFSAWLTCESIDFYKSKIKVAENKRLHVAQAKAVEADKAKALLELARHRSLVDLCVWAAEKRMPMHVYIQQPLKGPAAKAPGMIATREGLIDLFDRYCDLPESVRGDVINPVNSPPDSLLGRARTVFEQHFARPIGSKAHDAARLEGLALALFDKYPNDKRLRGGA